MMIKTGSGADTARVLRRCDVCSTYLQKASVTLAKSGWHSTKKIMASIRMKATIDAKQFYTEINHSNTENNLLQRHRSISATAVIMVSNGS